MGVTNVPSFWDQLGGAIEKFTESGTLASERQRILEQQKRQNALAEYQRKVDLANAGLISQSELQAATRAVFPDMQITGETPGQIKSRLLKSPPKSTTVSAPGILPFNIKGRDQATRDELLAAGMETPEVTAQAKLAGAVAERRLGAIGTPRESTVTGVPTEQEYAQNEIARLEPILTSAAQRYLDQVLNASGGQITSANMKTLSQSAFENFLATDRGPGGQFSITPENENHARSFFDSALRNAFIEQKKLELDRLRVYAEMARAQNNMDDFFRVSVADVEARTDILKVALDNPLAIAAQRYIGHEDQIPEKERAMLMPVVTQLSAALNGLQSTLVQHNALRKQMGLSPVTIDELVGIQPTTPGEIIQNETSGLQPLDENTKQLARTNPAFAKFLHDKKGYPESAWKK